MSGRNYLSSWRQVAGKKLIGEREGLRSRRRDRGQCRVCSSSRPVTPKEWRQAAKPRCSVCGGILDLKGPWTGRTFVVSANSAADIHYPDSETEFEIQAFLYSELRSLGLHVRGCVSTVGGSDVFDLVVYNTDLRPILIIEVKKIEAAVCRKQIKRYKRFGVPVDVVKGMPQAREYISRRTVKV